MTSKNLDLLKSIDVLGGITAEQFFAEYWQKKPLLVRAAMPEVNHLLNPDDIKQLALGENVSARLIKQKDKDPNQWSVKSSPLIKGDFQKLPKLWTLLVQAVDHYSLDVAELWKKFAFIPTWRRDDIMVSYAPKGGSVGQHFDFYDVFLVQGYGHRRWQLGQNCDSSTQFIPDQPLKLLGDMQVNFDEVLAPGDLLYVPPGLSHYGVAQNDCLTYSFGFRMPNVVGMLDQITDQLSQQQLYKNPLQDILRTQISSAGEVTQTELDELKAQVLSQLESSTSFEAALMTLLSEPKYPDNIPEPDEIQIEDLIEILDSDYELMLEPASRLIYSQQGQQLKFWANAEAYEVSAGFEQVLKQLADGASLSFDASLNQPEYLADIAQLLNQSILMLLPPEDAD